MFWMPGQIRVQQYNLTWLWTNRVAARPRSCWSVHMLVEVSPERAAAVSLRRFLLQSSHGELIDTDVRSRRPCPQKSCHQHHACMTGSYCSHVRRPERTVRMVRTRRRWRETSLEHFQSEHWGSVDVTWGKTSTCCCEETSPEVISENINEVQMRKPAGNSCQHWRKLDNYGEKLQLLCCHIYAFYLVFIILVPEIKSLRCFKIVVLLWKKQEITQWIPEDYHLFCSFVLGFLF